MYVVDVKNPTEIMSFKNGFELDGILNTYNDENDWYEFKSTEYVWFYTLEQAQEFVNDVENRENYNGAQVDNFTDYGTYVLFLSDTSDDDYKYYGTPVEDCDVCGLELIGDEIHTIDDTDIHVCKYCEEKVDFCASCGCLVTTSMYDGYCYDCY